MRTLVLDQGYVPHQIVSWQKAVTLLYVGKADVVESYADVIRSVTLEMHMPAVVRLRQGSRRPKHRIKFSRLNVFLRDGFKCQYCGEKFSMRDLTYDHVVPRAQGGKTVWQNIVTACRECNELKADRTPQQANMPLKKKPVRPTFLPSGTFHVDVSQIPDTWKTWMSWTRAIA